MSKASPTIDANISVGLREERGKRRDFILVWLVNSVSLCGSRLAVFALGVWLYQSTGSPFQYAFLAFLAAVAGVLCAPFAGAVVDRLSLKSILLWSSISAAVIEALIVIFLHQSWLRAWHLDFAVALIASLAVLTDVAYVVTISTLVPKEQLGRSAGMVQAAQAIAQILPPLLGGVLLLRMGLPTVIAIDASTYALMAGLMLTITIDRKAVQEPGRTRSLGRDISIGWKEIQQHRGLIALLAYAAGVNLFFGSATVLLTPLVLSFSNVQTLGFVLSLAGFGYLTGSICLSVSGGPRNRVTGILGSGIPLGFSLSVLGTRPWPVLVSVAAFCFYFFVPLISGCELAIWQSKIPLPLQGRVLGLVRMIGRSALSLGFVAGGFVAERAFIPFLAHPSTARRWQWLVGSGQSRGLGLLLIVSGVVVVTGQMLAYSYSPLRHLEQDIPDALG